MQEPVSAGFPLSLQQRNLWSWQAESDPSVAEIRVLIEGPLEAGKLRNALEQVVGRHEILRTSFQPSSGMKYPFQVVNANAALTPTTESKTVNPREPASVILWAFSPITIPQSTANKKNPYARCHAVANTPST